MVKISPLTIIIPVHNEATRLMECYSRLAAYHAQGFLFDVIFVENGSVDKTWGILQAVSSTHEWITALRVDGRGKGKALQVGVLASRGDLVYTADVDFSTPLSELSAFVAALPGQDVVIGSREIFPSVVHTTLKRRLIGRAFHALVGGLAPGIRDTQCGFKLYRRDVALDLFGALQITGLAYDVEILYLAHRMGYKVREIPVIWTHDQDSRVNLVRDSLRMFWDVLKIPVIHAQLNKIKLPA